MQKKAVELMTLCSLQHVFAPVIGLVANVMTQVGFFRFFPSVGLLKSELIGFIAGMVVMGVIDFMGLGWAGNFKEIAAILATNLITYLSLAYCYFNFINLGETARRIRIIRELYDAPKSLSLEEILERYNAKHILQMRIDRLINNKQLIYKNGRYYIGNPIMLFIAKIIVAMKIVLLGKKSEYDY